MLGCAGRLTDTSPVKFLGLITCKLPAGRHHVQAGKLCRPRPISDAVYSNVTRFQKQVALRGWCIKVFAARRAASISLAASSAGPSRALAQAGRIQQGLMATLKQDTSSRHLRPRPTNIANGLARTPLQLPSNEMIQVHTSIQKAPGRDGSESIDTCVARLDPCNCTRTSAAVKAPECWGPRTASTTVDRRLVAALAEAGPSPGDISIHAVAKRQPA